jgi:hypothetical protein
MISQIRVILNIFFNHRIINLSHMILHMKDKIYLIINLLMVANNIFLIRIKGKSHIYIKYLLL